MNKERYILALKMRNDGMKIREIGKKLGISNSRVSQLIRRARRMFEPRSELDELTIRARNVLILAACNSKDDAIKGITGGIISVGSIPNLGIKTYREICEWADIDPNIKQKNSSALTILELSE